MVRSIFSSSVPFGFYFKMHSKITSINSQLNEVFQKAKDIGINPTEIIKSPTNPREAILTDPSVDEPEIVGRSDDVNKIVSQLTSSNNEKDLSVIGIVGMGGQGKTTLAKLIINNNQVKKYSKKTIWTCVCDDFNVDRVLNDMLQSLKKKASQFTNREAIVEELSKELKGERFLFVLDDVWNKDNKDSKFEELWDIMKVSLQNMGGSKGSQIIVTTRDERVVAIMNGFVHQLGVLSGKASQELFEKMAFGTGGAARTPSLVKIGERIATKCGGVPLALKAMGRLMSSQRGEREWLKIEESSVWSTLDGVHSTLRLSFDHLPSLSLKQCFTYCSIFPKDSVIQIDETIQQWMANGLLNPSSGSDLEMEDVGKNNFKILLQRSLLQEAEFDMNGNITSCKMHDLVHDFALEASKGRCLTTKFGELSHDVKALHLSIVPGGRDNLNISERNFLRLRTLFDFSTNKNFLVHCKCKYLRALTLTDDGMSELPISIAMMKHLRYLDISKIRIDTLPAFISKMYNLQTLKFSSVRNLPKDFDRLVNLRHLYIEEPSIILDHFLPPLLSGIGQLTSLRTLNCFFVSKGCQIEELCNLNHLEGTIRIFGLENVANENDARKANLSGKRNVERLELVWFNKSNGDESVLEGLQPHVFLKDLRISNFMGRSLPSWIPLLHNLTSMNLSHLRNCEQIPPLGHLPYLKELCIAGMNKVKCIGNDFYGWSNLNTVSAYSSQTSGVVSLFPSLKTLYFSGMSSLEQWSDMVQPSFVSSSLVELFPRLEKFEVSKCPRLTHLPECILSDSTGLESLQIECCYKLVSVPNLNSLHSLKELCISDCQELSALPGGIEACKSLKRLAISCTARLMESLFHCFTNIRQLTSQVSNDIVDHYVPMEPIFNHTGDDIQGRDDFFSTVEYLRLSGVPQMKSLPEKIQCFTALRNLELLNFYHLDGLETLPEWLSNFHSLESLKLWACTSLANFPSVEVMRGLTNLKYLRIHGCPILRQRCERETGAEWHKIAHIPKIFIR